MKAHDDASSTSGCQPAIVLTPNLGICRPGLPFLGVFPTPEYEDISLGEWLAHIPLRLVNEHIGTGEEFLEKIGATEGVIAPEK
ncbi:MAG TPA: hypothetical protein VK814_12570 [Acidobacteriaceae bacterium]|jgi:hypothetical protein|nr:hypothetical protein [Acidobacteriaceae bacterium]